jgi:hypothetical protein
MIEIKVEMTQGKQRGAKITKWGPYEWAIGWRASTKGMSGGKKLRDLFPIMGRTSSNKLKPTRHKLKKEKNPKTFTTQRQIIEWETKIKPFILCP